MNIQALSVLFILILLVVKGVQGGHLSHCFSLANNETDGLGQNNSVIFNDMNFYNEFNTLNRTTCQGDPGAFIFRVEGIRVRNKAGREVGLQGYLHLTLDMRGQSYDGIIIQSQDSTSTASGTAAFGEFVPKFPYLKCPDVYRDIWVDGNFYPSTSYQFGQCQGIGKYYPLPSNSFVYYSKSNWVHRPPRIVHLFWRFTNDYCSHVKDIVFRVGILPRNRITPYSAFFCASPLITLSDVLTGAPDPLTLETDVVSCNENLTSAAYPWIKSVGDGSHIGVGKENQVGACRGSYLHSDGTSVRCDESGHQCLATKEFPELVEYDDHIDSLLEEDNKPCECPKLREIKIAKEEPPLEVLPSLGKTTTTTTPEPVVTESQVLREIMEREMSRVHGISVDNYPGEIIWNFRLSHGMAMVIGTLFVTPVSNFVARYYKETFMDRQIMFNRVWYMVHLNSIVVLFYLYLFGGITISQAKKMLGNSRSNFALNHRIVGWTVIGLYGAMTLLGGFRPRNSKARQILIRLHWGLGMIFYWLSLGACILSIYIHGSPSATSDVSIDIDEYQRILVLIVIWILVDIGCHIAMTFHAHMIDSLIEIKRQYLPAPMPIVDEDDCDDAPGTDFRKRMLIFYGVVSITITVLICLYMAAASRKDRGFGIMTCSHDELGALTDISDDCRP